MLPIGYGERAQGRVPKSLAAYAFGSTLGAGVLGLSASALGHAVLSPVNDRLRIASAITGVVGVLYGLSDASLMRMPRPQSRRQVPSWWNRRFRPEVTGLLYGVGLGVGVATRLPVSTFYLLPLWAFVGGDRAGSTLILAMFGLGRFLPLLAIGVERGRDGEALDSLIRHLEELEPLIAFGNGLLLTFVGTYLLVSLRS